MADNQDYLDFMYSIIGGLKKETLGGINNLVDVNNTISIETGLPASIFDEAKTGHEILLRHGLAGESYVFNNAGHEIKLTDLLVVCRRSGEFWEPCGNPVKDAMITKVSSQTTDVIGVVYAPIACSMDELDQIGMRYGELLRVYGGFREISLQVFRGT